jgi:hypothetical protein
VVDVELSRDEDSVTSLAVAQADDESIVALAGINSSQAEQQQRNNQHLRSFRLEYPPRKSANADDDQAAEKKEEQRTRKTTPLARTSLFKTNIHKIKPGEKVDTYQRVLRLSPWKGADAPRIAVIATGLAPSGEIVIFNVTSHPQPADVIGRIRLGTGEEAEDVDIIDREDGNFLVAYTNGVDVFTFEISSSRKSEAAPEVKPVYTMPFPDSRGKVKTRPKFRAVRFLSPKTLVLLQNAPDRTGCELVRLSLPSSQGAFGNINQRLKLRKSMKIGLGLDVCDLGESPDKERQYIIAAAGSDGSIEVFTLEYSPKQKGYGKFQRYTTLTDVHPFSMTKICFSPFRPPAHPVTSAVLPQYVKLASVSLGNTVVVHTFPLRPFPEGRTRTPRYVLKLPGRSETWETVYSCFVALLIIGISCFLLQAFTEIRGGTPAYLGAADWLPERVRQMIARPYMFEHGGPRPQAQVDILPHSAAVPHVQTSQKSLRDLLSARRTASSISVELEETVGTRPPAIVVRDDGVSVSVEESKHHDNDEDDGEGSSKHHNARRWEDLHEEERNRWKRRLSEAGHWTVEEGEQILRGIFFGELAAAVGAAVAG